MENTRAFLLSSIWLFATLKGGERMNYIIDFIKEEDAISVVEIVLIIVTLIGLVVIFKNQLVSLVNNILSKITSQSDAI